MTTGQNLKWALFVGICCSFVLVVNELLQSTPVTMSDVLGAVGIFLLMLILWVGVGSGVFPRRMR
jgi:hypothetical protein